MAKVAESQVMKTFKAYSLKVFDETVGPGIEST